MKFVGQSMNNKIKYIASRALVLLLAIQILNLSMNSIDFKPIETTNLTEFNDINTIAEFVSEIMLGKVNSFPEFATKTQKQSQLQKHISIKIINDITTVEPEFYVNTFTDLDTSIKDKYLYEYFQEINPPPPKA
jgi:hypothetical protein